MLKKVVILTTLLIGSSSFAEEFSWNCYIVENIQIHRMGYGMEPGQENISYTIGDPEDVLQGLKTNFIDSRAWYGKKNASRELIQNSIHQERKIMLEFCDGIVTKALPYDELVGEE